jgi:glutamate-1-semialdehyde 2,1-aminomutase
VHIGRRFCGTTRVLPQAPQRAIRWKWKGASTSPPPQLPGRVPLIDRKWLTLLTARERDTYRRRNPRSAAAYANADHLFGRVPMTWMNLAAGGFPVYLDEAHGATVRDLDGHSYADFALGDTGAMAGHSPGPTVQAVHRRLAELGGATAMLPTEDAEWVGAELTRRFGPSRWSFALTATDANRWALRLARAVTGRPKVLVNSYCYHGSVDESLIVVGPGEGSAVSRPGNVGSPVDVTLTSRVAEFNDVAGLEHALDHGDVAAVLMEPALTNIGIVLPEPGYLEAVRRLTRDAGALLINDETHTLSTGPGGATGAWGLAPDIVTVGKAIGGGIPVAAYGLTPDLADSVEAQPELDLIDVGGIGGTLAGNALSLAACRATLEHVLTDDAWVQMTASAERWTVGVRGVIDEHGLPWSVQQLGARAEYRFASPAPRTGGESHAATDTELDDYLHVYLANRDVLLTPFHNMALMCPQTTAESLDLHEQVFASAVAELIAGGAET